MLPAVIITIFFRIALILVATGGKGLTVPYCVGELVSTTVIAIACTMAVNRYKTGPQRVLVRSGLSAALGSVFFVASSLVVMKGFTSPIWVVLGAVTWGVIGLATGLVLEVLSRKKRAASIS